METIYKINLQYNLGEINSYFVLTDSFQCKVINNIEIGLWKKQQQVWIYIKNLGCDNVYIIKLTVSIGSIPIEGISSILTLPEFTDSPAEKKTIEILHKVGNGASFGSLIVKGMEGYKHYVYGFLSCKSSRNYIKWQINNENLNISLIYEFFNEELKKDSEIALDPYGCYSEYGYSKSINEYLLDIKANQSISEIQEDKSKNIKEIDILFSRESNKYSLRINNEVIKIKIGNKYLYPLDIRNNNILNSILLKVMDNVEDIIVIKNIKKYMELVNREKIFNVYKYIYMLMLKVKETSPKTEVELENCPLGLQVCINTRIITSYNFIKKPSFFSSISRFKVKNRLNYNAILQNIFMRALFQRYKTSESHKGEIFEILDFIQGISYEYKNKVLNDLYEKIDFNIPSIEFLKEDVLLSIKFGCGNVYIILINFSSEDKKVYFDASYDFNKEALDGIYRNILSNKCYLINDNIIYFKHVEPLSFDIYTSTG